MAIQEEVPLTERLCEASSPRDVGDWQNQDGYYITACRVSSRDIPELIEVARRWSDPKWFDEASEVDVDAEVDEEHMQLLPVTAWRTLADLKSDAAVEPLIDMLCELDDEFDDWAFEDLPQVFGKIGPAAIPSLLRLANDADQQELARSIAVRGLRCVVEHHPETREQIVAYLTELMASAAESADEDDIQFNTTVLTGLVELQATEAAEAIERTFAGDLLDVGMMGGWEEVRQELGVEGLGLEMPENPYNSLGFLRRGMGIGIFSKQPLFSFGEINAEAADAYYQRAEELFSESEEAQQIIERGDDLGWFLMLLEFGIQHLGQAVDELTLGSAQEFVLEHMPRKVSVEPDRAASILFELTMFWQYVDRVFGLPNARPIIDWLKHDGLLRELRAELSDSGNFGMAKSLFMSGMAAGYDMTSEAGMNAYMQEYNRSLRSEAPREPSATVYRGERTGRNELCPCGSGKKYKRCCRREA